MRYTLLGQSGLKVSELCLGTMGFGTEWKWGADFETSHQIMDAFCEAGGNFIDTANRYTEGTSEAIIGEYMESNGRDNFVLATKYTLHDNLTNPNASGNNRKNLFRSVQDSMERLQTDYIDLLYVHAWDFLTSPEEVMRGLDDLVRQGLVHYIGISDTPAWMVAKMNTLADFRGWSQFVALQVEYSLLQRTPERDLTPMAQHFGMTVTPWAPLAGGALTGKYLKGDKGRLPEQSARLNARAEGITKEVMAVAEELGCSAAHVALRWTTQQGFHSIPIVGATKVSQVTENIKAMEITLSAEQIARLNKASEIEMGFPHDFLQQEAVVNTTFGGFKNRIDGKRK